MIITSIPSNFSFIDNVWGQWGLQREAVCDQYRFQIMMTLSGGINNFEEEKTDPFSFLFYNSHFVYPLQSQLQGASKLQCTSECVVFSHTGHEMICAGTDEFFVVDCKKILYANIVSVQLKNVYARGINVSLTRPFHSKLDSCASIQFKDGSFLIWEDSIQHNLILFLMFNVVTIVLYKLSALWIFNIYFILSNKAYIPGFSSVGENYTENYGLQKKQTHILPFSTLNFNEISIAPLRLKKIQTQCSLLTQTTCGEIRGKRQQIPVPQHSTISLHGQIWVIVSRTK